MREALYAEVGAAHTDPSLVAVVGLTSQSCAIDRRILQCLDGWMEGGHSSFLGTFLLF